MRTEINGMPHIFGLGQNLSHNKATPIIRIWELLFAFPYTLVLLTEVNGRGFDFVIKKNTGNLIRTVALNGQAEDPADNGSGFLVDMPSVLIARLFLIAIDSTVRSRLARFALDTDGGALLAAQITKIPFVHDIQKRGKFVAVLVIAVHTVGNRNKVNTMLTEKYLGVKAGLQIVTTCTAHILYNDMSYLACFNICDQPLPRRSFKGSSTPTVIGIVDTVFVAPLCGIAFEVFFLIDDGVAIPGLVIVTG